MGKWEQLNVGFSIRGPLRGLSATKKERLRLSTMIAALEGREPPQGCYVSRVYWSNPDANHYRQIDLTPGDNWLTDQRGLPTLNRSGWYLQDLYNKLLNLPEEKKDVVPHRRKMPELRSKSPRGMPKRPVARAATEIETARVPGKAKRRHPEK